MSERIVTEDSGGGTPIIPKVVTEDMSAADDDSKPGVSYPLNVQYCGGMSFG